MARLQNCEKKSQMRCPLWGAGVALRASLRHWHLVAGEPFDFIAARINQRVSIVHRHV